MLASAAPIDKDRVTRPRIPTFGGGDSTAVFEALFRTAAILATVRGEMAFRSIYIMSLSPGPLAVRRAAAEDLAASAIRLAVARASRGGTMLRRMSIWESRASSVGRSWILAARMRSIVC